MSGHRIQECSDHACVPLQAPFQDACARQPGPVPAHMNMPFHAMQEVLLRPDDIILSTPVAPSVQPNQANHAMPIQTMAPTSGQPGLFGSSPGVSMPAYTPNPLAPTVTPTRPHLPQPSFTATQSQTRDEPLLATPARNAGSIRPSLVSPTVRELFMGGQRPGEPFGTGVTAGIAILADGVAVPRGPHNGGPEGGRAPAAHIEGTRELYRCGSCQPWVPGEWQPCLG
eukprot:jgi/Botrbrau1/16002/Bobra.0353s0001.2